MKQTIKEAAREAIHKHYNCNGTYPCSEREYCEHCNGHNTAFDCCECGADEFKEGFIAGANWRINSVWHDAANGKAENKPALIEYTHRDGSCGYLVVPNPQEVKEAIDRWAYIEDLLPNTEE